MCIGTKANNLVELKENGFNVPEFKILNFDFFTREDFLKKIKTSNNSDETKEIVSEYVNLSIKELDLDVNKKYAVRSSSSVEDGNTKSFAGQFHTSLNVDVNDVVEHVILCLASLYNDNVIELLKHNQFDTQLQMSVIIQEMVDADYAGICFSANPQGILNQQVITCANGLGDKVVEDRVVSTTYQLFVENNLINVIGEDILDVKVIKNISGMMEKLQELFGQLIDVEFAVKNEEVFILQVRPITTINMNNMIICDNSNIVESYPGVNTPLTINFAKKAYTGVFKGLVKRLTNYNQTLINKYDFILEQMVVDINNHLYYQIQNWYYLIQLLPFKKRLVSIWQNMLGIENKFVPPTVVKISFKDKILVVKNLVNNLITINKQMDKLHEDFLDIYSYYQNNIDDITTIKEIKNIFEDLEQKILLNWDITLINDLYAFIFVGIATKKNKDVQLQISGIEEMASMKPVKQLIKIKELIDENQEAKLEFNSLLNLSEQGLKNAIKKANTNLTKELNYFIDNFGNRVPEELKLETKTFETNPHLLLEKVEQPIVDVAVKNNEIESNSWIVKNAKKGIANREQSRLDRTTIFAMVRNLFLKAGKIYHQSGKLNQVDDIFFLEIEEVFNQDFDKKLIESRKRRYINNKNMNMPRRIEYSSQVVDLVNANTINDNNDNHLHGIGTSSGIVEGEVVVINSIDNIDVTAIENKIIVTPMTDPGWVYLLMNCKGIIAQQGSLLSHTAIISRELNKPAIVNVANVMNILQTGDKVKVNGTTGDIEVIEHASSRSKG